MPRFPDHSDRAARLPASVYERFREKFKAQGKNLIKLHIGDTYRTPPYPLPLDAGFVDAHPDFNRYCNTFGVDALRKALAKKSVEDNRLDVTRDHVLVTAGATNALSVAVMTLIDPGDEVLVLTPCWPFFPGMVTMAGGRNIEVPFYTKLYDQPDLDIAAYLDRHVTPKTAAVYFNSPNNPSGKVVDEAQMKAVAEWAKAYDLWVISDEAYDALTFDGRPHVSIASLDGMFERTISIFTFSKIFMFAGLRLGYAVAPEDLITVLNKIMVHQLYSPSTMAQQMVVSAVESRHEWMEPIRKHYQDLRDVVDKQLRIAHPAPEGTYFTFVDIEPHLRGRSYWQVVEACLDSGVSVAVGEDFGRDFATHIRLCFTGENPQRVEEAVGRLNRVLTGGR